MNVLVPKLPAIITPTERRRSFAAYPAWLIAAALLIFFLMLLSLSERIGFGLAYLSAASACVLLAPSQPSR
jgi:inner membrane protein involved in colicin E2 resistance